MYYYALDEAVKCYWMAVSNIAMEKFKSDRPQTRGGLALVLKFSKITRCICYRDMKDIRDGNYLIKHGLNDHECRTQYSIDAIELLFKEMIHNESDLNRDSDLVLNLFHSVYAV